MGCQYCQFNIGVAVIGGMMRKRLLAFGAALSLITVLPAFAQSNTDPWQVADRMLDNVGGREPWASAQSLYVREKAFPAGIEGPLNAEFWRDLEIPAYRSLIVGPSFRRETRWSEDGGWVNRDGVQSELSADEIMSEISGWRQEPYVMYHKLALHDSSLHLVMAKNNRLEIFDGEGGALLCWFVIDALGAPLRWGNVFDGEINEHIYGPLRNFGPIRMPAWGTSTTGSWRFEYQDVVLMAKPLDLRP